MTNRNISAQKDTAKAKSDNSATPLSLCVKYFFSYIAPLQQEVPTLIASPVKRRSRFNRCHINTCQYV